MKNKTNDATIIRHRASPARSSVAVAFGGLALLAGVAGATVAVMTANAKPAAPQQATPPPVYTPTERIDVEQGVDFPYDI